MLEVAEVGNQVGKEEYNAAIPDLRVGLINAQYDLRHANFRVIIWIAGDDRLAANELVNRLNEWMDSPLRRHRVFADPTDEEYQRPHLYRLWRSLPPRAGRPSSSAASCGRPSSGPMTRSTSLSSPSGCAISPRCRKNWSPMVRWF